MRSIIGLFLLLIWGASPACSALLPPTFLDSVVAIGGTPTSPPVPGQPAPSWRTNGTGFFYGRIMEDAVEVTDRKYAVYLVTERHVVEAHMKQRPAEPLSVRLNPSESGVPGREFPIENSAWFLPKNTADLTVARINFGYLNSIGIKPSFFASDLSVAGRDKMKEAGVSAGDGIFVLGFPMNLAGGQRNYVVVRQGCIARLSEMIDKVSKTFIVDTFVFPGNSGGPVVLRPEIASIQGTEPNTHAYLISIVLSYHPYIDAALSAQTGRPRVVFEENSGLAEVLPTDFIDEAIDELQAAKETPNPM